MHSVWPCVVVISNLSNREHTDMSIIRSQNYSLTSVEICRSHPFMELNVLGVWICLVFFMRKFAIWWK